MFKHQPCHISIMNTEHDINFTAILDLHEGLDGEGGGGGGGSVGLEFSNQ